MKTYTRIAFIFCLIIAQSLFAGFEIFNKEEIECQVFIKVKDKFTSLPIAGAQIDFLDKNGLTNQKGISQFVVYGEADTEHTAICTKDGYITSKEKRIINKDKCEITFVLASRFQVNNSLLQIKTLFDLEEYKKALKLNEKFMKELKKDYPNFDSIEVFKKFENLREEIKLGQLKQQLIINLNKNKKPEQIQRLLEGFDSKSLEKLMTENPELQLMLKAELEQRQEIH